MSGDWPLWEVFIRSRNGLAHKHVGSLHASDATMALQAARDIYTRRGEGLSEDGQLAALRHHEGLHLCGDALEDMHRDGEAADPLDHIEVDLAAVDGKALAFELVRNVGRGDRPERPRHRRRRRD